MSCYWSPPSHNTKQVFMCLRDKVFKRRIFFFLNSTIKWSGTPPWREICMQVKRQQLELDMEKQNWFQIRKGVGQGYMLSPCLFNLYAEYIMWSARLDEAQAGIKIAGRNINYLRCRWYHPYGRKQRRTKKPLDESERGEWKSWLKPQHSEN